MASGWDLISAAAERRRQEEEEERKRQAAREAWMESRRETRDRWNPPQLPPKVQIELPDSYYPDPQTSGPYDSQASGQFPPAPEISASNTYQETQRYEPPPVVRQPQDIAPRPLMPSLSDRLREPQLPQSKWQMPTPWGDRPAQPQYQLRPDEQWPQQSPTREQIYGGQPEPIQNRIGDALGNIGGALQQGWTDFTNDYRNSPEYKQAQARADERRGNQPPGVLDSALQGAAMGWNGAGITGALGGLLAGGAIGAANQTDIGREAILGAQEGMDKLFEAPGMYIANKPGTLSFFDGNENGPSISEVGTPLVSNLNPLAWSKRETNSAKSPWDIFTSRVRGDAERTNELRQRIAGLVADGHTNADLALRNLPSGPDAVEQSLEDLLLRDTKADALEKYAIAIQESDPVKYGELMAKVNDYRSMTDSQVVDMNMNPVAEFVYGSLVDPTSILGPLAQISGLTTAARMVRGAKKATDIGQVEATARLAAAGERTAKVAGAGADIEKVWKDVVNPFKSASEHVADASWVFEPTAASKAATDLDALRGGLRVVLQDVENAADARTILMTLATNPKALVGEGVSVTGKTLRGMADAGGRVRFGPGLLGSNEVARRIPLLGLIKDKIADMGSLKDPSKFNKHEFMAELLVNLDDATRTANGVKEASPLWKALSMPANIQRMIMNDIWLGLRPANWWGNALGATGMSMANDVFSLTPNKVMDDYYLRRGGGFGPNSRINEVMEGGDAAKFATQAGGSSGWIDSLAQKITGKKDNLTSKLVRGGYDVAYGSKEIPLGNGAAMPISENSFYRRAYYTTDTRAYNGAIGETVKRDLIPTLQTIEGMTPNKINDVTKWVRNELEKGASKSEIAQGIRSLVARDKNPFILRDLGLAPEVLSPMGVRRIEQMMADASESQADRVLVEVRKILNEERNQPASLLSIAPTQPGITDWTDADMAQTHGWLTDTLSRDGVRAGMDPATAQQQATDIARSVLQSQQDTYNSVISDLANVGNNPDTWSAVMDFLQDVHFLKKRARQTVDELGNEAVRQQTPEGWARKWEGTKSTYEKQVADMAEIGNRARIDLQGTLNGKPYQPRHDWMQTIEDYINFDEEEFRTLRGVELGSPNAADAEVWQKKISAERAYRDNSFYDLFGAFQRVPSLKNFDIARSGMLKAEMMGAAVRFNLDQMLEQLAEGKISKQAYARARNKAWATYSDAVVVNNQKLAEAIVRNGILEKAGDDIKWTMGDIEYRLEGKSETPGKYFGKNTTTSQLEEFTVGEAGDTANPFVVPKEVVDNFNRLLGDETAIDKATAQVMAEISATAPRPVEPIDTPDPDMSTWNVPDDEFGGIDRPYPDIPDDALPADAPSGPTPTAPTSAPRRVWDSTMLTPEPKLTEAEADAALKRVNEQAEWDARGISIEDGESESAYLRNLETYGNPYGPPPDNYKAPAKDRDYVLGKSEAPQLPLDTDTKTWLKNQRDEASKAYNDAQTIDVESDWLARRESGYDGDPIDIEETPDVFDLVPEGYKLQLDGDKWSVVDAKGRTYSAKHETPEDAFGDFKAKGLGAQVAVEAAPTSTPSVGKQPWEMTLDEYAITIKERPTSTNAKSFEQWAKEKGISPGSYASEYDEANYIGGTAFPTPNRTAAEAGKLNGLKRKVERRQELLRQYQSEVEVLHGAKSIDPDNTNDLAYIRAAHKRAIRNARSEGNQIPPEVLAQYPELALGAPAAPTTTLDDVRRAASDAGVATASKDGRPTDKHLIASINKRLGVKVKNLDELTPAQRADAITAMAARGEEQVSRMSPAEAKAVTPSTPSGTGNMFGDTAEDLPTISGMAPRAPKEKPFVPKDATTTESMFDMRPQMGNAEGSYAPKTPVSEPARPVAIVDGDGNVARVIRWEGNSPVVVYPGNKGGRQGSLNAQRYEYTLDKWSPTTTKKIQSTLNKTKNAEERQDLGRLLTDHQNSMARPVAPAAPKERVTTPGDMAKGEIKALQETRDDMRKAWDKWLGGHSRAGVKADDVTGPAALGTNKKGGTRVVKPPKPKSETFPSIDSYVNFNGGRQVNLNLNKGELRDFDDVYGTTFMGRPVENIDDVQQILQEYSDINRQIKQLEGDVSKSKQFSKMSTQEILKETRQEFVDNGFSDAEIKELAKDRRSLLDMLATLRGDEPGELGMVGYDYQVPSIEQLLGTKDTGTIGKGINDSRRMANNGAPQVGEVAEETIRSINDLERTLTRDMRTILRGKPNELTGAQGLSVVDRVTDWLPNIDNAQARASQAAQKVANWVMLNYNDRRRFDSGMSLLTPYHYYWSRMPGRALMAAIENPHMVNLAYEAKRGIGLENEQADIPQRLTGTLPIPGTDKRINVTSPLMYLFPWASYTRVNPFVEENASDNDVEKAMNEWEKFGPGLNMYVQILADLKDGKLDKDYSSVLNTMMPVPGLGAPVSSLYQGLTGQMPAQGNPANLGFGPDEWDPYRARRATGWIAEEEGLNIGDVSYANQVILNQSKGLPVEQGIPPERLQAALALAERGVRRAAWERTGTRASSYTTMMGVSTYGDAEKKQRAANEAYWAAGYDPITNPSGNKDTQKAIMDTPTGDTLERAWKKGSETPAIDQKISELWEAAAAAGYPQDMMDQIEALEVQKREITGEPAPAEPRPYQATSTADVLRGPYVGDGKGMNPQEQLVKHDKALASKHWDVFHDLPKEGDDRAQYLRDNPDFVPIYDANEVKKGREVNHWWEKDGATGTKTGTETGASPSAATGTGRAPIEGGENITYKDVQADADYYFETFLRNRDNRDFDAELIWLGEHPEFAEYEWRRYQNKNGKLPWWYDEYYGEGGAPSTAPEHDARVASQPNSTSDILRQPYDAPATRGGIGAAGKYSKGGKGSGWKNYGGGGGGEWSDDWDAYRNAEDGRQYLIDHPEFAAEYLRFIQEKDPEATAWWLEADWSKDWDAYSLLGDNAAKRQYMLDHPEFAKMYAAKYGAWWENAGGARTYSSYGGGGGGGGSFDNTRYHNARTDPRYMDRTLWESPMQGQRQWIPYSNPQPDWLQAGQQLRPDFIRKWMPPRL